MKHYPRIMLISPPLVTPADEDVPKNTQMPIGLAYIAAVLEREGYADIKVLDAFTLEDAGLTADRPKKYHGLSPEGIRREIADFRPDIVGVSSMYTMYSKGANAVIGIVKEINRNILIVCGGAHATINPEMLLEDKDIDLIVKGEGEQTFLEVVRAYESKGDIYSVEGIIYRKDGRIYETPPRPLIRNLDTLPFPARHYMPMKRYFENTAKSSNYYIRHPSATVVTSRGCPGRCIYCCVEKIWGRAWRGRSAVNVADEIELLIKDYGIREVQFTDDCLSADRTRLQEICRELIRRRLDIKWTPPAGIAIWQLNKDLLRIMKASGCYRLTFGLESGDPQTLKFIGKSYSYDYARQVIREANRLGIWTAGTFIIGFPSETKAQIRRTIKFALSSRLDFAVFYTPIVFAGTQLFEEFRKAGIAYDPEKTGTDSAYSARFVTDSELFKIRSQANTRLFINRALKPWRLLAKVKSREDLRYLNKVALSLAGNFIGSARNKESAFGLLRRLRP